MEPHVDISMQNTQISVWMQTRRKKKKRQSWSAQVREKHLESANWLKQAVFGKKPKNKTQEVSNLKDLTQKARRNVGQHVHLGTHPGTHLLHKHNHTELPPIAILFLFFNDTVFLNSVFFNLKSQLKIQTKYIFCFPVQKRSRCLGSIHLHCNSWSGWHLCRFKNHNISS